ncbi:hypothetical protein SRABI128_05703 [Microbacterium sp. Bi128]|nr:hypothetical protein SRABI128_05703 [Microbacterium sp. Bi128]
MHHGLGEDDAAFRHADQLYGLGRRDGGLQRSRVSHADVLSRRDHDPAGHEPGVLTRLQHPGKVVQRGVDVGTSDRLDERAGDVVMLVPGPVVADGGNIQGAFGVLELDLHRGRLGRPAGCAGYDCVSVVRVPERDAGRRLERGQRTAGVPAGEPDEVCQGLVAEFHFAAEPAVIRCGPQEKALDVGVGERFQGQQQRAGQQRGNDGEGGVFGGRGDQDHPAVLDAGQQGVLLGLVEAVDLIQEEDGGGLEQVARGQGFVHHAADVLDTGGDGGELDELPPWALGNHMGKGGLAGTRRAPEDQ